MKKLRFGVIGTNEKIDKFIETTKSYENLELVSVYCKEEAKAVFFAQKHGIVKVVTSLKDLINTEIDFVYISTYSAWHYEQAKYILGKGVHVIVDKPISLRSNELEELYEIAMKNNAYFIEGLNTIHHPYFKEIKKNITTNLIGDVYCVTFNNMQKSPKYEEYQKGMKVPMFNKELGGGSIIEKGVLPINLALYLFGEPYKANAYCLSRSSGEVDKMTTIILEYAKFNVTIHTGIIVNSIMQNEIVAEKGNITFDSFDNIQDVCLYKNNEKEVLYKEPVNNDIKYYLDTFLNILINDDLDLFDKYYSISLNYLKVVDDIFRQIGN